MYKAIKNILTYVKRTIGYTLEFVFFLIVVLFFVIQAPQFQTFTAKRVASYLSQQLNAKVNIDKVRIDGLHYLKLEGLYLEDQEKDTLLYAPEIIGGVKDFSLKDRLIVLDVTNLKNATIKLQKYKGKEKLNTQFLVDYFLVANTDKKKPFKLLASNIKLEDIHFSYNDWNSEYKEYGVDYKHIDITELSGGLEELQNHGSQTRFLLNKLSFKEQSGFVSENLSAFALITSSNITISDVEIVTPLSDIKAKEITFNYSSFSDFKDFVNAVVMKLEVEKSQLSTKDLSYFVPVLEKMSHVVTIKGNLNGLVNELSVKDFYFGLTKDTYLSCDAEIKGLPYIEDVAFYIDINEAQTYRRDIEGLDFKALGLKENLKLPKELNELGIVNVSGSIDGFYDQFLTKLDIASDIGSVGVDLGCSFDKNSKFKYIGEVNTAMLELGRISGLKELGVVSSNLELDGSGITLNELDLKIKGDLPLLQFKEYDYKNIKIDGQFVKTSFKGLFSVKDENIDLTFDGEVNMNENPLQLNFTALIDRARLFDLNLIDTRESSVFCVAIEANGFGGSVDDFSGYVHLNDVSYYENGKDYYLDSIFFESQSNNRYHSINVFSEFAELSMDGNYSLDSLPQSLYGLGAKILPSFFSEEEQIEMSNQQFDLDLKVNDLSTLTELVFPALEVSNATSVSCKYESNDDLMELSLKSDFIKYKNVEFRGVSLDTTTKISGFDPFYVFDLKVDSLLPSEGTLIENIQIQAKAYQDNVASSIFWGDDDSTYWGRVNIDGYILSPTRFETEVLPSEIFDEKFGKWTMRRKASFSIDTSAIDVNNLVLNNGFQTVRLDGKVSERPIDQLNFEFGSFELSNLNDLINEGVNNTELGGVVNLSGFVSDVYGDIYFDAYSWIDDFKINNQLVGDVELNSNWNDELERVELVGNVARQDGVRDFEIKKGYYYPKEKNNNLDFDLSFNNADLTFVNVFLPPIIKDLKGQLDGGLTIKGELNRPKLQGDLFLDSAQVTVEMLNTTYFTSGNIKIEEDLFGLEALPIRDKFGSEATLVGTFFHDNFKGFNYDFFAFFDRPFLVMNTSYEQNDLYYGTAFATGDISINYEKLLEINVNAKSEKGTNITLPLYGSEEVVLEDFIAFVNAENDQEEYEVSLDGINLNLSLDITEDAEIQLVFDDLVGDAMKATGAGHIDMYIDQFYDFYMFGNYTVNEGSYLFSLRDFISKKFNVKEGGTISWYGNPYDADINLTAVYPVRASLYDIVPENEKELYRQKSTVECEMNLTNSLFNPNIDFNINLPRASASAKSSLENLVSTSTEMNRQVFSLLILNKFLPRIDAGTSSTGLIGSTTSEMLSNQLSNMLANFTDDFDVGFNYRPGDQISNNELALALSTQLLNDKLTISTNLGVSSGTNGSSTNESSSNFIGDVDVEYQLNDKGNVRVHAFNKSNEFDAVSSDNDSNTQGVGIFYQEDFSSFKELICKIKHIFKKGDSGCDKEEN